MLGNWRVLRSPIEERIPSPAKRSAMEPQTPKIVMNIRCLYRKILRAVTFCVKFIRFQSGVMRSKRILEPDVGGFGRRSWAGFSPNSRLATMKAGRTVDKRPSTIARRVLNG